MTPFSAVLVDPGLHESAVVKVVVDRSATAPPWGIRPYDAEMRENGLLLQDLDAMQAPILVIEVLATIFNQAAARDQLITERWAGRFIQAHEWSFRQVGFGVHHEHAIPPTLETFRQSAKAATVGKANANDAQVRRALIDIYGGDSVAIGGKRCKPCKGKGHKGRNHETCEDCMGEGVETPPGPLHGWTGSHFFAALALGFAAFRPGGGLDKWREENLG